MSKRPRSDSISKEKHSFASLYLPPLEDNFYLLDHLGHGTYGIVQTAIDLKQHGKLVALKMFDPKEKYAADSAKREIETLKRLQRETHIVQMLGTFKDKQDNLYMAMELASYDLGFLIHQKHTRFWSLEQLKACMHQIATGIHCIHAARLMHRDLKPDNILCFQKEKIFKICDFGMAKNVHHQQVCSNQVTTRWYRDPQLLLGSRNYAYEIDIWSLACIFGTLLLDQVLFPGDNDAHQLLCIWSLCGTPDKKEVDLWPPETRDLIVCLQQKPNSLMKRIGKDAGNVSNKRWFAKPSTTDFLSKLLILTPCKRMTAEQVLKHAFFTEERKLLEPWEMVDLPVRPADGIGLGGKKKK